jgi:dTDP-4-amino-4,6-dideoxygalactose transaminase
MISVFGAKVSEKERSYLEIALSNNWLGYGPLCQKFEQRCSIEFGIPHFLMVNSGTSALYLAVKALGLPPGSEVILPSFTYIGCATAVIANQLIPVFADVDPFTQNLTAAFIAQKITPKTKAIIVVHYAGLPVDMHDILQLNIPVIEDAAHAIGATSQGKRCGTKGRIGIYSFDGTKNIASGEGGGICLHSQEDYDAVRSMRLCGVTATGFDQAKAGNAAWWEEKMTTPGLRFIPSDVSGAIALGQLDAFAQNQFRRRQLWQLYQRELSDLNDLHLPSEAQSGDEHGYFTYFARSTGNRRNALVRYLLDNEVYTTLRYQPLHYTLSEYANGKLDNTETLAQQGFNLPLHPSVSDNDIDKIISLIHQFYQKEP